MNYTESKRVDTAIETLEWLKDRVEDLEKETEQLQEKVEELQYSIDVTNGTQSR